jgi:hypothetical protein
MTKDGRLTFLDLDSYLERDFDAPGSFISDSRIVTAQSLAHDVASRIDVKANPMRWSQAPFDSYGADYVRALGTNTRGDVIGILGFYGGSQDDFILRGNTFISLQALLKDMAPGEDWTVHSLNDINDCGEVVGVIGKFSTLEQRGILLSPPGCR